MTHLAGARVLLIDPDILLAVHLTDELARQGAPVPTVTPTAERAVKATQEPDIAAAVVDPCMDTANVMPAVEHLLDRQVPVMVTSLIPYEHQSAVVRRCSFMRKPYSPRALALRLADMIDGVTMLEFHPKPQFGG
jgi:DNA-binding response OmpR family regulator